MLECKEPTLENTQILMISLMHSEIFSVEQVSVEVFLMISSEVQHPHDQEEQVLHKEEATLE
jgi:hypothetical protein